MRELFKPWKFFAGPVTQADDTCSVYVYHHTHWDREWYLPFREYQVRLAEVVDAVLERLESGVLSCFTLDGQTVVLDDYLELRPENRDRLALLIKSGRLNIGPWFVMPDEFLVGGESLVRNLKHGIGEAMRWDCAGFSGYLPDTFGHSGDIPLILRNFGLETAIVWRGLNPKTSEFLWKSRNGDAVFGYHLAEGYFQNFLHDPELSDQERRDGLKAFLDKGLSRTKTRKVLLPVGADHLGPVGAPQKALLGDVAGGFLEVHPHQYLEIIRTLLAREGGNGLSELTGELRDNTSSFILPGVYSARLYLKRANRRLEHSLVRQTEQLVAMAQFLIPGEFRPRYPKEELAIAWRELMLNHPHDSICGCSVDEVHRENETRYDQVRQLNRAIHQRQRKALVDHAVIREDGEAGDHWVVFHFGDLPYTGVVTAWSEAPENEARRVLDQVHLVAPCLKDSFLTDINDLPQAHRTVTRSEGWIWVDDLPPHSISRIPKNRERSYEPVSTALAKTKATVENAWLKVEITKKEGIVVTDKRTGRSYPGVHEIIDHPDRGDSYNSAPVPGGETLAAKIAGFRLLHEGPLVGSLEVAYEIPAIRLFLSTRVMLEAGNPLVNFQTTFINRTPDHKLQAVFSTGAPIRTVTAESHFGVETRQYDPHYSELSAMPADRNRELATNTGPVQRFFMANGHYWVTEGLSEYEVAGERMRITLLRAFGYLSKGDTGVRGAQAGPPLPTPEGQCIDRNLIFRYAWTPLPEQVEPVPWAYHHADRFYGTVFAEQGVPGAAVGSRSLVRWDDPAIVSTAIKRSDEGNALVVRLVNTTAKPRQVTVSLGVDCRSVHLADFMEKPMAALPEPVQLLAFEPYAVKTLLFRIQ